MVISNGYGFITDTIAAVVRVCCFVCGTGML